MKKKYSSHISVLLLTFVLVFMVSGFLFPQTIIAANMVCVGTKPNGERTTLCAGSDQTCKNDNPAVQNFGKTQGNTVNCSVLGTDNTIPPNVTGPASDANKGKPVIPTKSGGVGGVIADILLAPLGWLAILILQIASLITYLSGIILNFVVITTVVKMADNLKDMEAINLAWKTIRDVANMGFIFILLYAAIKTILGMGDDIRKLIVNIVIVAILINFSLFFTKVVIDASNVLAITFYDAIAPGATASNLSLGLSSSLMEPLKITTLWKITSWEDVFAGKKMIIVGVMGTVVSLIAAFVFFAVAIMLVIRFVVLIFVMILSPLAFMGYILPQLKKHKDDWIQALLGQAFFAPIYFMLTWIVIVISRGLFASAGFSGAEATATMAKNFTGIAGAGGNFAPPPAGSLALLMNFIIMIVFLIASLVIAKQWANKAGYGVPGLTKWATGFAGGATIGMAGRLGRNTVGRAGQAVADSQWLKDRAPDSRAARLALAAAKRTGVASFDMRGTPLSGQLDAGKAGGKGGYRAERESKIKKRMEFAQDIQDTVTGADVEREMGQRGYGKAENRRLGRTAAEVEAERRDAQQLLIHGAEQYTAVRRERYLHNLSQTRLITPNLYSGVSEDAEAARRLRAGQAAESTRDRLLATLAQYQNETNPPAPPPPAPPPTP